MTDLAELLRNTYPLSDEDINLLIDAGRPVRLRKGEPVIRAGRTDTSLHIICEGVLRAFVPDGERDTTIWFATPGEVLFSTWGYVEGAPSPIEIAASCDCSLLSYTREQADEIFSANDQLRAWRHNMLMKLLLSTDRSLVDLSDPSAAGRYARFERKMPMLLKYVPLKEIAGYLGITPQSLSRIRAALARKKHEQALGENH